MPKKTREEKMAAQLRRMKEQLAMRQSSPVSPPPPKPAVSPQQPEAVVTKGFSISESDFKKPSPLQPPKEVGQRYDYTYITRDLRKIATLAAVAVALEIALNLTTRAGFAKLILRRFGIEI